MANETSFAKDQSINDESDASDRLVKLSAWGSNIWGDPAPTATLAQETTDRIVASAAQDARIDALELAVAAL